jgi:hypothetical protein
MIFEDKFKNYKSLYLCISGGADSALGLFLISKYITENNLNTKITIVTGVEPQPHFARNDKNAKKIVSIISNMFPNVNIENHLITFVEGYDRQTKNYPKVLAFRTLHENNWKNGDYDLGISFVSSFPKLEELKKHKALYNKSLTVGPEDRSYTGKRNDLIQTDNGLQKMYKGKGYWKPFLNMTKKDFADLYEKHNLMDSLFPYTASCVAKAEETNNFTKPCQQCFWCLEKYWAYGMFDYPEAYNL